MDSATTTSSWIDAYQQSLAYSQQIWQQMLAAKGLPAGEFNPWQTIQSATCARELVHREGNVCLYHYTPQVKQPLTTPVLLVYALINRPSILDITPERSFIRGLLNRGADVYLLDWGNPTIEQATATLSDYINGYLHRCVMHIRKRNRVKQISLLGICQGGIFSLCYASLYPQYVKQLITMVTPVDFHTPDDSLSRLLRDNSSQAQTQAAGNIPGAWLTTCFLSLRPAYLQWQKYQNFLKHINNPQQAAFFWQMERWIYDNPDHPGKVFHCLVHNFYQNNLLIKNGIRLNNKLVKLSKLTMPILNLYASEDHIVPPAASTALANYVNNHDYQEFAFEGGHIGIFVSASAQQQIPPLIVDWLQQSQ